MKKNIPLITDREKLAQSCRTFSQPIDIKVLDNLTHGMYSSNSLKSMVNDWNRFVQFCQLKQVNSLPASVSAVRIFLENEGRKRKYSSIRRYALTIGAIHRLHSLPEPTNHRRIKLTLSEFRLEKSGDARSANAFTCDHLDALFDLLGHSVETKDIRDLAIYSLMFECAMKRSELKHLTHSDISSENEIKLLLGNQQYQLSARASEVLRKWMALTGNVEGCVFCRIDKHENLYRGALNDSSIYRIFRRASDLLGLPEELKFSGQSTRVGAARELASQGYNVQDIKDFGRWLSPAMPAQYLGRKNTAEQEIMKFTLIKPWD
ncbi:tyrosine-type recombinase/integrase [Vibrio tapetis]|uniref:Putative integrase n=1 Tax=Vibrio tapetis subsp. tapetis TaxID=1671868 RepID=A0A2N8ZN44_9VIBR|nr:tyrosine-type recombinase/integrase [Vibrio tapetis]SON53297.1 putative integrase [Vibrio tapetis subsp. tapetis]